MLIPQKISKTLMGRISTTRCSTTLLTAVKGINKTCLVLTTLPNNVKASTKPPLASETPS
jgi:hypothetical protein